MSIRHKWAVRCQCGAVTGLPGPGQEGYTDKKGEIIEFDNCIRCGEVIKTRDGYWLDGTVADKESDVEDMLAVE